ncbi:MAG: PIN domain-containing protein [Acidimicrobiia bacterium]
MAKTQEVAGGLTLDASALIAVERLDRDVLALLRLARANGLAVTVSAGVLAQVWRDGQRQVRLARLLASANVEVEPLDERRTRQAGQLCGACGTSDVVDASVVLCARERRQRILTSDVDDLRRLDPAAVLVRV